MRTSITYNPIGTIRTPFTHLEDMPIQAAGARNVEGRVEVFSEYAEGLADVEGFSHIFLLYHLHQARGWKPRVIPFLDTVERGLFATRAPRRPNGIGLSVVELLEVRGGVLRIRGVDMLDSTPLLDIKPYVARFDTPASPRSGWLERLDDTSLQRRSDRRFTG